MLKILSLFSVSIDLVLKAWRGGREIYAYWQAERKRKAQEAKKGKENRKKLKEARKLAKRAAKQARKEERLSKRESQE